MIDDCGGHVMASGNCSCEVMHCCLCGTAHHHDSDAVRYFDAIEGWACVEGGCMS